MDWLRKADQRILASAVYLLFLAAGSGLLLAGQGWDARAFIFQGTSFQGDPQGSGGYDGQFAYAIASDPTGAASRMPVAAYRYQRILYPLIARTLALGQSSWLPWTMLLVNLASLTACTWLLADRLAARRASPWWSLSFALFGGIVFAGMMDLNEPLAFALALLGLRYLDYKKYWLAGICFALGGLSKEVALVFAAGAGVWLLARRESAAALKVLAPGVALYLAWAAALSAWLGEGLYSTQLARLERLPFAGLWYVKDLPDLALNLVFVVLPTIVLGSIAFLELHEKNARSASLETYLVLANVALISFMPRFTWVDWLAALRLEIGLVIAGLFLLAVSQRRFPLLLPALWTTTLLLPAAFGYYLTRIH